MELKPNCGSDRAWVYSVPADYADEEIRPELLAIKFANSESMSVLILHKLMGTMRVVQMKPICGIAGKCDWSQVINWLRTWHQQSIISCGTRAVCEKVGTV
jgi:hypothetical protein